MPEPGDVGGSEDDLSLPPEAEEIDDVLSGGFTGGVGRDRSAFIAGALDGLCPYKDCVKREPEPLTLPRDKPPVRKPSGVVVADNSTEEVRWREATKLAVGIAAAGEVGETAGPGM